MAEGSSRNSVQKTRFTANTLEQSNMTAQETTHAMGTSCMAASKGAVELNLKLMEAVQENLNAALEFARQVPEINSPSTFFELSAAHVQKQFENLGRQTQQLTGLAQRAIIETTQSWQSASKSMDER